ncbi:MAG: tRNA glutamyl-Q(34) synthetase GluQRS [Polyangiaceae bacterium]|nr:tRNA glutamyl-Q(34) synthetase GluQRS [Polyangiaceae bacterium]
MSTPRETSVVRHLVGRLAPSPTGLLHLGHAHTFLLAWWHLRSRGGAVLLRVEDLDGPRCRSDWVNAALRDLEWLGCDWDGAWTLQSNGIERLRAAVDELGRRGLTYPCTCSRTDVRAALSAPQQGSVEMRYPGTCLGRYESLAQAEESSGRAAALRFRVPPGKVEIDDGFCGRASFDVQEEIGDFVVARRDHSPAYQLAVVVDDAAQGVTEVHRGQDLLSSTARQQHLRCALGLPEPLFFHLPLVVDGSGRRLAKRCDAVSLAELRERGTDPRAIVAWVARSAALDVPARVSTPEVTPLFRLERIPRAAVRVAPGHASLVT